MSLIARRDPGGLLTPPLVATLLVANLVPAMALMVLFARRLALRRASTDGARAEEPAAGPAGRHILGDRARADAARRDLRLAALPVQRRILVLGPGARDAGKCHQPRSRELQSRDSSGSVCEAVTMSGDLAGYLRQVSDRQPAFAEAFARQVYDRNLSEAIYFRVGPNGAIQSLALVNPYDRALERAVTPQMIAPGPARERRSRWFAMTASRRWRSCPIGQRHLSLRGARVRAAARRPAPTRARRSWTTIARSRAARATCNCASTRPCSPFRC